MKIRPGYTRPFAIALSAALLMAGNADAVDTSDRSAATGATAAAGYRGEIVKQAAPTPSVRALRKLWHTDPAFARTDELVDYGAGKIAGMAQPVEPAYADTAVAAVPAASDEVTRGIIDDRLKALRKLWRTNPAFAQGDGLVDYGAVKIGGMAPAVRQHPAEEPAPALSRVIEGTGATDDERLRATRESWLTDPTYAQPDNMVDYGG